MRPDAAKLSKKDEDRILKELNTRFTYAKNEWRDTQAESQKDRLCLTPAGAWDAKDRQLRSAAGRPCIHLDELTQYVNQLINEARQNKRAIKVTPQGNGANDETAEFRANLIRQIEYRSNAQQAYIAAFEGAAQGSYGFARVKTAYVNPRSMDQEVLIEPIPNPDMVLPDPDFLKPDLSDCKFWFVWEKWPVSEFQRDWPHAKIQDFSNDMIASAPNWLSSDRVQIAEYWTTEYVKRTLWRIAGPNGRPVDVLQDEKTPKMPKGAKVLKEREVEVPQVMQYMTNGVEILDVTKWAGQVIPLAGCLGKLIYVTESGQSKRIIQSLIRLGRDGQQLFDYYRSTEAEIVGMTPKTPFIGYVGQFRTRGEKWEAVNHEPQPFLEADPLTEATGSQILPLPQRQPYDPAIQALEVGAESARRSIQSAVGGGALPTSAQRRNEKSGVALQEIEKATSMGSYHFLDHFDAFITRMGVIVEGLIDPHYDTIREMTVRDAKDEASQVVINDQNDPKSPRTGQGEQHDITLSTGPSFDSQREQAQDFADLIAGGNPQVFALLGPLIVKLKDLGPIGDEIAELLKFLQPPEVREMEAQEAEEGLPPQVKATIAGLKRKIEEMGQALETQQAKQQAHVQSAEIKAGADVEKAQIAAAADVQVAEIRAEMQRFIETMKAQQKETDQKLEALNALIGSASAVPVAPPVDSAPE